MPKIIHTKQLIEDITNTLNCSHQVLANLMGISPHTLSNNKEKQIEKLTPRTKIRLLSLYCIVVGILGSLRPEMIYEILNIHIFADRKGRKDSVISALQQDKYELETLEHIAKLALQYYEEKRRSKLIGLSDVASNA